MGERSRVVAVLAALIATTAASSVLAAPVHAADRVPADQVLNSLPVAVEEPDGYRRSLFRHWITQADGCTTRQEVLIAERRSGAVRGCSVTDGRWVSAYDGRAVSDPSALDIDHMVPLFEAWQSGAWRWTAATRTAYANDLGYVHSLIAVTAATNRSKADRDPQEWLPARDRCGYVAWWIAVKYRWRLSVDSGEKHAISQTLRSCSASIVLPPLAARETVSADPGASDSGASGPGSSGQAGTDPRFRTCGEANASGYGPYLRGRDPEYDWYIDRDGDGRACEP